MYKMLQLLGLLVTAGLLSPCVAETFYVTPTLPAGPPDCPQPCDTLDHYAQHGNLSDHINNITLIFLKGVHNLNRTLSIYTNNITLQPALPNLGQRPKVIGQLYPTNSLISIASSNVLIAEILFENVLLSVSDSVSDSVGFTATFRWCSFFGHRGGLVLRKNTQDPIADSSIVIKKSTISHTYMGVWVIAGKKVLIEDSVIFQNDLYGVYTVNTPNVTIVNSNITDNSIGILSNRSGITLRSSWIDSNDVGVVLIRKDRNEIDHCCFTRNRVVGIWVFNQEETIFKDCTFDNNNGTPILAYQSTFQLSGENVFVNNIAVRGGGLALYQSQVIFDSGSTTRFENNTALEYGGGIYIATEPPLPPQLLVIVENGILQDVISNFYEPCFYNNTSGDTRVTFFGNNASFGGRDIFGVTKVSYFEEKCSVSENSIFYFDDSVPSTSRLASNPSRVCFCVNDTQNSTYLVLNKITFPGESFETSVALVGFNFSRVTGTVFATVLDRQAGSINDGQHIQSINDYEQCTTLTYTVLSNQRNRTLQLSLSVEESFVQGNQDDIIKESVNNIYSAACMYSPAPCAALLHTAIFINITIDKCPLGFQLNTSSMCGCDEYSKQLMLTCEIQNHTGIITREGTVWVGVDTAEQGTDVYYWYQYCPTL
ncbi:uncharacterized protein LOC135334876 [Halichondria panicea]|uniref:uncharacterized protein LOC135334876 n=1 Tax=Halichondria panicea TaxID=6063 RepID=UPI00312B5F08